MHQGGVGSDISCVSGGLAAQERKLAAVATKLVTCPALLLLEQPFRHFCQPQHFPAALHLLSSLKTAARQLHVNVIIAEESVQDAAFAVVDNLVMLDQSARPVYAGPPFKVSCSTGLSLNELALNELALSCE